MEVQHTPLTSDEHDALMSLQGPQLRKPVQYARLTRSNASLLQPLSDEKVKYTKKG